MNYKYTLLVFTVNFHKIIHQMKNINDILSNNLIVCNMLQKRTDTNYITVLRRYLLVGKSLAQCPLYVSSY